MTESGPREVDSLCIIWVWERVQYCLFSFGERKHKDGPFHMGNGWEQANAVASLGKLYNRGYFILLSQGRVQKKAKWYNFPPVLIYYLSTGRDECKLQNVFTQIHFHIWTLNIYLFLNKWRLGMKEDMDTTAKERTLIFWKEKRSTLSFWIPYMIYSEISTSNPNI